MILPLPDWRQPVAVGALLRRRFFKFPQVLPPNREIKNAAGTSGVFFRQL